MIYKCSYIQITYNRNKTQEQTINSATKISEAPNNIPQKKISVLKITNKYNMTRPIIMHNVNIKITARKTRLDQIRH